MRFAPSLLAAVAALSTLSAAPMAFAHDGVHVDNGYVLVSGKAAKSAAAFLVITNHSGSEDKLLSVTSPAAQKVALHSQTQDANGVMSMRPIEGDVTIAGHGTRAMERGGDHVMLMGLTKPLETGDTVPLTLTFERGDVVTLDLPVNPPEVAGAEAGEHSGH